MMGGHSVASPCDDFTKGVHLRRAPLVLHGASSAGNGREQAGASAKDTAERHHRETPQRDTAEPAARGRTQQSCPAPM